MRQNIHLPYQRKGIIRMLLNFSIVGLLLFLPQSSLFSKSIDFGISCLWKLEKTSIVVAKSDFSNSMCLADAGTITPDEGFLCVPGTFATLIANPDGNMVIPSGYAVTYLLTTGANSLILQTNGQPNFLVSMSGLYTIHTLVYDPTTFDISTIIPNTTILQGVNIQLEQGGGTICGSLDLAGASTLTEKAIGFVVISLPETCDDQDGQVELAPPSNSFLWFDGFMGSDRADLADGTYLVTVTAGSGCSGEIEVIVGENCANTCTTTPQVENIVIFEASCGDSNGSATIEMVGDNFLDYTYQWSPPISSSNIGITLASGNYSVTITDADDATCFTIENFQVGNQNGPDVQIVSISSASCSATNGEATLEPSNLTYNWCDGGNGASRNDLAAGSCVVTVTDPATGCTNIIEVIIPEINNLTTSVSIGQQPSCNTADGNATISVSGGSGNYIFQWSDGGAGASRFGLSAGTYQVTVTDTNDGCETIETFSLTNSVAGATVNISSNVALNCSGDADGFVNYNIQFAGGFVQPASEVIQDAFGNSFINGDLSSGNYCVLAFDGNGCLAGESCFEVTQPAPLLVDVSVTNKTCDQLGTITSVATGGNSFISYNWSDLAGSSNPPNRNSLEPGTYILVVMDTNGCSVSVEILVEDDCVILACNAGSGTTVADTNPVCLVAGSATISATPNGAVIPTGYIQTFVLTTGGVIQDVDASPVFTVNNLGSYTIHSLVYHPDSLDLSIVVLGTTTSAAVNSLLIQGGGTICGALDLTGSTINVVDCTSPCISPEVLNIVKTASNCGESTGTATVNIVGNNGDFTFAFSSGISSGNSVSGLASGSYTVTISETADPSCLSVENFTITNADGPEATILATAPTSCEATNGSAQLSPANFDYAWCDGGSGAVRSDLPSGICGVTVTDIVSGCTNILEVEIEALNLLNINPLINQIPDCGMSNGVVVLSISGGSNDYTFEWSDVNSIDNAIRTDLPGGVISVTVTDNGPNGCVGTTTFTLMEDVAGMATIDIQNTSPVSCPGEADGSFTHTVTTDASFVQPASEQILDGAGVVYTNGALPAGDYCLEVKDANGCVAGSECFTIEEPEAIVLNVSVTPTTCSQGGNIDLNVNGGTGNYNFDWSDLGGNNNPEDRFDMQVGSYDLTVTDTNGCSASLENILVPDGCTNCPVDAGTLQADSTNICFDGTALAISAAQVLAPTVPAGYTTIYVLTEGTSLEILQANAIPEFAVNALGNYTIHTLVFDPSTLDPTSYTNGLDLNADLLQGGGTICAALDVNGASISLINCAPCVTPQIANIVTVESTCGNFDGSAMIEMAGSGSYIYEWSIGTSTTNTNSGLEAGSYYFTVTDASNTNCSIVDSIIIGNADGPDLNIFSQTPTSCGANNGTAVLQPQTNLFDWSDGISGAIRTDLAPGINVVTVTDPTTNCINVYEIFIESLQLLNIQIDIVQQPDCQASNGEVEVTIIGGSTDYTYIWSDNSSINAANRTGLSAGAYNLVVIDNGPNGCTDSVAFVLLDTNVVGATVSIFHLNNEVFVSCTGDSDALVDYTVTADPGFIMPQTELIVDANGVTQTNGQLAPGDYCILVLDGNGCVAAENCFEVINPSPIDINIQPNAADCNDLGSIITMATGGTGFLLFDWDDLPNSSDPQNRFNIPAGLYSLTVTDQNVCTAVVNDILIQDNCNSDCPTSSVEMIAVPVNTTDSFCVVLDSCFIDSLTTYELLGGGLTGSSIFGSWMLNDSCLVYSANDSAGVAVDTIYVLSNFNVLTDTTIIIVTVIPPCTTGGDIITEDSISLTTSDCVAGADYCLEIELAQILNFTLSDNGLPYGGGLQGCNFDTTFFYSLSAFLAIAPDGPYSLTSWEVDLNIFTIDSFQTALQLVDSMNVWDPFGNWTLDGSIITGGNPGTNYGSLNIIQLITGASTNLDVDLNQIPNGSLITLDTGFHELIITDLVTGCLDTLFANVICDDCPDIYSGPTSILGDDCNGLTDLCLDIPFTEFLFNFDIIDNGSPYTGIRKGCGFDTLSTCYFVSALPDQGAAGPYTIQLWEVGSITFASNFNNLQELLNLMNGWDPSGNWILDATAGTICGGSPGQFYGTMEVSQVNTGAIAELEPDYVIQTFASAIELDTGFHQLILIDTIAGCTDTLEITIDCDVVTGGVDTLLIVEVTMTDTFCFNLTDTIVSATNLCPELSNGNVSGFGFIPNTNCIEYTGQVVGLDTFCMVFEYSDGTFDTTGIVIQVVPQTISGDTIPLGVLINCVETYCIDTSAFLAPIDTIYNDCGLSSGMFADVAIIDPNCIEVTAFNIGGLDTACIIICDTFGVCDTTVFLIDVTQPELVTVYDTVEISQNYTYCPDTTQLYEVVNSITNYCDSLSGTSVDFTVDSTTFCVDYDAIALGTDTACLVVCDDFGTCDTTIYIVTVINPIDTIIANDDDTVTVTINPVTIDIFANDIFNPDSLIFGVVTGVTNGTLVSNPDGSFTYLAQAGFCGQLDSFTYFISNGTISDTATVTIEVLCDDLFVFNGFSPNNDFVNETLQIQGIDNFGNNEVTIFNRWGNLVYRKFGYTNADGWDGNFEGKTVPSGTYFYCIDDGEGQKYYGWLQVWR